MNSLLPFVTLYAVIAVTAAQQFPFIFVRAVPILNGYRETHASACTRVGMLTTDTKVFLSASEFSPAVWDAQTLALAAATINASAMSNQQSCCSATMFCDNSGTSCWTSGFGGMYYENSGWTTNDHWIPVFTCASTTTRPDVPVVGRVSRRGATLVIDGLNLGVMTRDLRATVDGQPCDNVDVCTNVCRTCVVNTDCGDDKQCVSTDPFSSTGNCLRSCNADFSCPCGTVCQVFVARNRPQQIFRFCVDPQASPSDICGDGGPWFPPSGSNLTDRLECMRAPSGVYGQSLTPSRRLVGPDRRQARALRAASISSPSGTDDAAGDVLRLQRLPSHAQPHAVPEQERSEGARALLSMQPGWQRDSASELYVTPLCGTYRYSSISAGSGGLYPVTVGNATTGNATTRQGAFPVVVVKRGWASTGLGAGAAAALRINVTLPVLSDPSLLPFADLTPAVYTLPVPAWTTTTTACTPGVNSTCPAIDTCTVPTCSSAGACVYLPTASCTSSGGTPYSEGEYPTHITYMPLPALVTGALPMIPTPIGDNPARQNPGQLSDPAQRTPSTNAGAINWHPGSVWWSPSTGLGDITLRRPFDGPGEAYRMLDISYEDDGPMDDVTLIATPAVASAGTVNPGTPLPWSYPFFGSKGLQQLSVSPNGYIRMVPNNPCNGQFQRGSCTLDTDYAGVISPLTADFAPQQSATAAYYAANFDLMPLAMAALNATSSGPGSVSFQHPTLTPPLLNMGFADFESARSAAPGRSAFCLTALEIGLYQNPPSRSVLIANPSFSTHTCVNADGSVYWRYGQVLGVPGIPPGAWNSSTAVNTTLAGPPRGASWFAGVRSLSAVWDFMELKQGPAGAKNSTVGISQEVGLLPVPGTGVDRTTAGVPDVTARTSQQVLANVPGVKPGGTAALCALNTVACASPACGPVGTVVNIRWSGLACGLGMEPLLPSILSLATSPSIRAGGQVPQSPYAPRLQCVFGTQSSPATWVPPSTVPRNTSNASVTGGPAGVLSCPVPALAAGTSEGDTVTLRVQAVMPATPAAWARYMSSLAWARPEDPNTWSTPYPDLGIGLREGSFDSLTGMLTLELPLHGMTSVQGAVMATPLVFRYSNSSTCGCSALSGAAANLACDACGACGGDGTALDCAGTCFGKAVVDDCGVCSAGTTQKLPNADKDCDGVCFGPRRDCEVFPTPVPNPGAGAEGLTHVILYFFIVGTPLVFCTMGLTWASYWWCLSASDRERREQLAVNALVRDPEALGIRAGLSDAQLDRIPIKAWSSSASEFSSVPGRTEGGATACPVCMEDFREGESVRMLPGCSHTGHVACFDTWLMRSTTCPVCRAELRTPQEVQEEEEYRRNRALAMTRSQQRQAARRVRMLDAARTDRATAEPAQVELATIQESGSASMASRSVDTTGNRGGRAGATGQRPWAGESRRGAAGLVRNGFAPSIAVSSLPSSGSASTGAAAMPIPMPMMGVPEGMHGEGQGQNWSPNPYGLLAQAAAMDNGVGGSALPTEDGVYGSAADGSPSSVPGSVDGEEMEREGRGSR